MTKTMTLAAAAEKYSTQHAVLWSEARKNAEDYSKAVKDLTDLRAGSEMLGCAKAGVQDFFVSIGIGSKPSALRVQARKVDAAQQATLAGYAAVEANSIAYFTDHILPSFPVHHRENEAAYFARYGSRTTAEHITAMPARPKGMFVKQLKGEAAATPSAK